MGKSEKIIRRLASEGWTVTDSGEVVTPGGVVRKLRKSGGTGGRTSYWSFNVKEGGSSYPVMVHRLKAYLKFGESAFKNQVRHLNGDSLCNKDGNIGIGTASQNMLDRSPDARLQHARKAAKGLRKLTDDQVREIRESKERGVDLAARMGVVKSTISGVRAGRLYSDVL